VKNTKTDSLKTQSAWLMTAKVIGFAFSFVLPLMVVRYLAQDAVGQYREAFQVITNVVAILPLGFSMSSYYFLSRETERRGMAVLNILLFNCVAGGLACLTLCAFPQTLEKVFQTDQLNHLAPAIGLVIWIWIFSTFLEVVALANREARVATAFIILASCSKTLLMGAALVGFGTVEAFIYAAIIQGVIQTVVLFAYLRSRFHGWWKSFDFAFFREQIVYAVPYGLAGVLWIAQNDIHNYFVMQKFSPADFAVYAYGCFEVPLIAMLTESVTSVLIPRMSALQLAGDREEMIRITARAMQKLAFFFFPVYAFLLVTAPTFITTLFTEKYAASVPIFMINLTLLPTAVMVNDPIIRAHSELGRRFLVTRMTILAALVSVLYFGFDRLGMTGMIGVAVAALLTERVVAATMVGRSLGVRVSHLTLFKDLGKTAIAAGFAGVVTYFLYAGAAGYLHDAGEGFARSILHVQGDNVVHFSS